MVKGNEKLVWKPDWNTGFESIDHQHHKLLQAINAMNRTFDPEADRALVDKLFDALQAYARVHFKHEEVLMLQAGYDKLAEQQAEHQEFINQVVELCAASQDPLDFHEVMSRTQAYLLDWLVSHILEMDMLYRPAFKKAGIK
ncbi:MAG: bacteriohemerythrin [bacterium]|nr:bacteriohemerythrin [bacterium]